MATRALTSRALAYASPRPVSLQARVRLLQRELKPHMTWMEEEGRAAFQSWLTGAPDAPELLEELQGYLGPSVRISAALGHPEAREAMLEVSRSMLTFKPSREEHETWEQHS